MSNKKTNLFSRYNRVIRTTFAVVFIASLVLTILQFTNRLRFEENLVRKQFQQNTASLQLITSSCVQHVNGMRTQAEQYLDEADIRSADPLFQYLEYDTANKYFHLDRLPDTFPKYKTANVTGVFRPEKISEKEKAELNMALSLNRFYEITKQNIPNVAWVYYTAPDFISIYPWVNSSAFKFTDELLTHEFYTLALPQKNPEKEMFWSSAYIDEAGKGMMVSCAAPVYHEEEFRGSVALDITLDSLNAVISRNQLKAGKIFIANRRKQLIAHPTLVKSSDKKIKSLKDAVPEAVLEEVPNPEELETNVIHNINGYFVYTEKLPYTGWELVYIVKTSTIYGAVFLKIGWILAFVFISIIAILLTSNYMVTKGFIEPSRMLIQHLQNEHNDKGSKPDDIPKGWRIWFRIITEIFQAKRELLSQLEEHNKNLESLVKERTKQLDEKANELEKKNAKLGTAYTEIQKQNKKIRSSIHYAQRIQSSIMGGTEQVQDYFPDGFIFFKPRDIVSGDFYWFADFEEEREHHHLKIMVAADCTGHGVPGAFMTVMGNALLNQIVINQKITNPGQILHELDRKIVRIMQQDGERSVNDGMDMSIIVHDTDLGKIFFAGAKNPLYFVRNNKIREIKGSKFPIGSSQYKREKVFETQTYDAAPGDMLYIASDGYQDQFGGKQGRKFMKKRFRNLLHDISEFDTEDQEVQLGKIMAEWMEGHNQTDDILVMGIRIKHA